MASWEIPELAMEVFSSSTSRGYLYVDLSQKVAEI
jgi:hypothetical protein